MVHVWYKPPQSLRKARGTGGRVVDQDTENAAQTLARADERAVNHQIGPRSSRPSPAPCVAGEGEDVRGSARIRPSAPKRHAGLQIACGPM
jgi:hypothetical protein